MNQQYYDYQQMPPQEPQKDGGICIASMVVSLVSMFCCNTLYLVSLTGIILGIVGICTCEEKKGFAIAGIIIGVCAIIIWVILDICLAVFTGGLSFCL